MQVGSASTRLVILRGPSASGKTTTALALRPRLGPRTALIHQDQFRRELLGNPDRRQRSQDASALIIGVARHALDLGYDVILDGIFNLRDYAEPFEDLVRDHLGTTRVYQFDLSLAETVRRHENRPLRAEFGPEKLHEWYDGWQPLPRTPETRVTAEVGTADLVERILRDLSE